MEAARSAASFMDGCGEAGEAQGILDGSNFVATSLQLRSDFVATSSDLACKEHKRLIFFTDWIQFSLIFRCLDPSVTDAIKTGSFLRNGNLRFLTHSRVESAIPPRK